MSDINRLCRHKTCPVQTNHISGYCQYHREKRAEVHAQSSVTKRL